MNREIKFRGKTPEGKWVYGVPYFVKGEPFAFIINNCQTLHFTNEYTSFQGVRVLPETIGQLHNSLTSKVGKEVYVGDKIVYDLKEGLGLPPQKGCKGVVGDIEFDYGFYENVRVYGTIHDKETEANHG